MGSEGSGLKILFFPFMAQGHILPTVDMAKLFAARGVRATILTTPANARLIEPSIKRPNAFEYKYPIELSLIPYPSAAVGLPEGCENVSYLPPTETSRDDFLVGCAMMRDAFDRVVRRLAPDCVVTDMFFPWTCDVASEIGVPRLVFHGFSLFALSVCASLGYHQPLKTPPVDEESFVIPGIPHRITMLRSQVADFGTSKGEMVKVVKQMGETDGKDYGVLVNSFYELEPDYVEHYRNVVGRRAWCIGPLSLCNSDIVDKSGRGNTTSVNQVDCLNWLDGKSVGSVVYVCFGSMSNFSDAQMHEIASGLEASNYSFIWVVRKDGGDWLPKGFEERVKEKGLIIRGWAPQILILNHAAVGGFLTHCGWNSSLEGISAGLPLITWPLFAEQFYNERLIICVLKIGVSVGVTEHCVIPEERLVLGATEIEKVLGATEIEKAVSRVMGDDEEAEERRERARELGEAAKRAVEEGGSSYADLDSLIQELMVMK